MNGRQVAEAGLRGWRATVADRVAPAVSRRTRYEVDQVREALGALFLALALIYLAKAIRELARR